MACLLHQCRHHLCRLVEVVKVVETVQVLGEVIGEVVEAVLLEGADMAVLEAFRWAAKEVFPCRAVFEVGMHQKLHRIDSAFLDTYRGQCLESLGNSLVFDKAYS